MATLSPAQIAGFASDAGFKGTALVEAVAIALAESGGRTGVTSSNPDGGTNVGLWQLDTPGGGGAGFTAAQLSDPQTNADVAFKVSKGGADWGAWATWASGAWEKFRSEAQAAAGAPVAGGGQASSAGGGGGGLLSWPADIVSFFTRAGTAVDWLLQPSHWVRIWAGFGGGIMVAAGIWLMSHAGGAAA